MTYLCPCCGDPVTMSSDVDGKLGNWYYCAECNLYTEKDEVISEDDVQYHIKLDKMHAAIEDAIGDLQYYEDSVPEFIGRRMRPALMILKDLYRTLHEEAIGCARKAGR